MKFEDMTQEEAAQEGAKVSGIAVTGPSVLEMGLYVWLVCWGQTREQFRQQLGETPGGLLLPMSEYIALQTGLRLLGAKATPTQILGCLTMGFTETDKIRVATVDSMSRFIRSHDPEDIIGASSPSGKLMIHEDERGSLLHHLCQVQGKDPQAYPEVVEYLQTEEGQESAKAYQEAQAQEGLSAMGLTDEQVRELLKRDDIPQA